jgi:hypothetical protein
MFDFTSSLVPLTSDADDRPLPERIAAQYGFPLAHKDHDDGRRYYAVQDWIAGVAQPASHPGQFWNEMKKRYSYLVSLCQKLPYRASDGKSYQMDHAQAEGLIEIARRMARETGIARAVLEGTPPSQGKATGVYIFSIWEMPGYYKIGVSKDVQRRLADYNTAMPFTVVLEYWVEYSNYRFVEKLLHKRFRNRRIKGEWFMLSDDEVTQTKHILMNGVS